MATEVAKAYVQIVPSADGISGSITQALDSEATTAGKKAGSLFGNSMSVSIGNIVSNAVSSVASSAASLVSDSISAGSDFDKAMSQVAATMGKTVDEVADLRDFAQQMGSTTAFSATQAAEALNYMALAGYDSEKSMSALPAVLDLAAAGGIALGEASDMVTDAQSALGLSMDETFDMVNQMAKASSISNTSVAQLGDAILKIGATARNVKGGTRELATILGVLADNGIKGAEGGTHLRNILLSLQDAAQKSGNGSVILVAEDQENGIEEMSVQLYDAEGNMRSLVGVINEMKAALGGMSQEAQDAVTSKIFNKTDLSSINALLGTEVGRYAELQNVIGNVEGSASEMANTQLDNLAGDVTLFQSALEGAQIAISDALTPTLREFTQFGSETLSALTQAYKNDGIDGVMEALGDQLSNGVEMLLKMVPGFISTGEKLLSSVVQGLVEMLPDILTAGGNLAISIIHGLSTIIPQLISGLLQGVKSILLTLTEGEGLTMILDSLVELVTGVVNEVSKFLIEDGETVLMAVMEVISTVLLKIPEILPTLLDTVVTLIDAVLDVILGSWPEMLEASNDLTLALIDGLVEALPKLGSVAGKLVTTILSAIIEYLPEIVVAGIKLNLELAAGIVKAIPKVLDAIIETIFAVLYEAQTYSEELDFFEIGENMIQGIIEGISTAGADLINSVKNVASSALNAITDYFKIGSPSKLMRDKVGKYIPEGMALGIEDEEDSVANAMNLLGIGSLRAVDASFAQSGSSLGAAAYAGAASGPVQLVAPIYIGDRLLDTVVTEATNRYNFRTGGR